MTSTAAIRNRCMSLSLGETVSGGLVKQRVFSRARSNAARVLDLPSVKARVVSRRGWVRTFHLRRQDHGLKVQFERLTPPLLWPTNCPHTCNLLGLLQGRRRHSF